MKSDTMNFNNFELIIITPEIPLCQCNRGYYIDEYDNHYGKEVKLKYKHFYDPITLQLLPRSEGKLESFTSKLYGYNPHTQERELIYEPQR